MQSEYEPRVRSVLRQEVADLPFAVTEQMVERRIAAHRSRLSRKVVFGAATVASVLIAAGLVVTQLAPNGDSGVGSGQALSFPVITPEAGPLQPLQLPTGQFVAAEPFDGTCVAIQITESGRTPMPALWWAAGASDDCTVPSSSLVPSVARLDAALLRIEVASANGERRDLTLRFTGATEDEIRFARQNEFEVAFRRID